MDLVCDREYFTRLGQLVYFGGLLIGVFGAGWIADYVGRKRTLIPITFGMGIFGLGTAFVNSVIPFIIIRFFQVWHIRFGIFKIIIQMI